MFRSVPTHVLDQLAAMPVFEKCSSKELRAMASIGTVVSVEPDYVFTRQGRRGFEFFVVLDGEAVCSIDEREVARFRSGEFFGEMGLIDHMVRSATVVATTAMNVLVIDSREFGGMVELAPSTARQLLKTMSQRLRAAQGDEEATTPLRG